MTADDSGTSGPDAARADGGPGPTADQGGAQTGAPGPPGDRSSDDKPSDGESVGPVGDAAQFQDVLGQGRRSGRRAPEDPVDNLFVTEVTDEDLAAVYVEPDEYGQALQALTSHRVVVLRGRPGSGRHAMARHLLLHRLAVDRIDEAGHDTELGKLKPRQRGSGFLLERCPPERARRLRADELRADKAVLERWQGYLVITVDDGVPVLVGEPRQQLVECTNVPDLRLVLERHLDFFLRGRNGLREEDREWLDGEAVRRCLARHGELRRTVQLVHRLKRPLSEPVGPDRYQRLERLLEEFDPPDQRAKRLLERDLHVEHWSYVIALAVFERSPAHVVADAAAMLARRLAPGDPRSDTTWRPRPARGAWLDPSPADPSRPDGAGLLLQRLAPGDPRSDTAWRPGPERTERLEQAGAEAAERLEHAVLFNRSPVRCVQFKDPELRPAILDRVWNEHDELRGPVRDWLEELGGDVDPDVREQAATAVGYLARHGLGYVLDLFIVPWGSRPATRESAAVALGALVRYDKRFTKPVLALLSQWARWGDEGQRETAAMAYGRAIGQRMPSIALGELRALAMREGAELPVAWGLYELVRRWRHEEVLEAVHEWTARPDRATWSPAQQRLVRTGLTGFLLATHLLDEASLWPLLLGLAEEGPEARERIVVLWRRALADDVVGEAAAWRLCGWAREADYQASTDGDRRPDLVGALGRLVADVAAGAPANVGRVRQALNRCAQAYDDPSTVARQLVDHLG
jgi:hypothetical protein